MSFLVEGSTGARAVQLLREQPQGTVIQTPQLAEMLSAKQTLLHQLLANAVNLRLIKKVRVPGSVFTGWKLGAGNDSANIERRAAPAASPADAARRAEAAQRRVARQAERAAAAPAAGMAPILPDSPAWLGPPAALSQRFGLGTTQAAGKRPSTFIARWDVLYRDGNGLFRGELQVQAALPGLCAVDAWCDTLQRVERFDCAGFLRIADNRFGRRVDIDAWMKNPTRYPPLVKPPRVRPSRAIKSESMRRFSPEVRLDERRAAAYLGVSLHAFRELRCMGALPLHSSDASRHRCWRRAELTVLRESLARTARELEFAA